MVGGARDRSTWPPGWERSASTTASGSACRGRTAAARRPPPARSAAPPGRCRSPAAANGAGSGRSSATGSPGPPAGGAASSTGTSRRPPRPRPSAGPCRRHRRPGRPATRPAASTSAGCGRRPPVRPGRSGVLEVRADPVLSAGVTRHSYRLHVPAGYRPDRAVPAGGGVVAGMACDLAGRVASVAVVSGALYAEPGECRPSRPVPLLDIHGTADPVVPYGGRTPTVEWPLPMPPVPTWLAGWATRDGCPGDPAAFLDTPRRPGSAGAAAATAARWCTTASTGATTRRPGRSPAGPSPRSSGTSSPPTRFRARRPGT
jgi:hypothetical protein